MQDFKFTGLWPQTEGNPPFVAVHRGVTPTDALIQFWATCLPGAKPGTPLRCHEDGHIYHLRLDEEGYREIKVKSRDLQFVTETI
jgi:hypothetical protein